MYTYIKSPYWKHWAISLALMTTVGAVMKLSFCFAVPDLIAIEFANTYAGLLSMISHYEGTRCNPLYNNTLLDFGFMLAYSLVFYFSGRIICDLLEFSNRKWLWVLFVPLLFDLGENLTLLSIMPGSNEDWKFTVFYYSVRLKWLSVIPAVLLAITVILYQLYVGIDKVYCYLFERRK